MDLRIIKTESSLKNALCNLVKEKDFEKISVKDICEAARINRITFYDHYKDKYDLLNDIFLELDHIAQEKGKLLDIENNPTNDRHQSLINYLLSYVIGLINRSSLIESMSKNLSGYIYFAFQAFLKNRFKEIILYYNQEDNLIYDVNQTTSFISNGLMGFVISGISNAKPNEFEKEFYKAQNLFHGLIDNHIIFK